MDNTKTDLLQTIKDQVAKEWFLKHKPFVNEQRHQFDYLAAHVCLDLWPEVCKRYAFEVAKASLKEASKKAKLKTTFKDQVIQSDFARLQSGAQVSVDKESITNVLNISL